MAQNDPSPSAEHARIALSISTPTRYESYLRVVSVHIMTLYRQHHPLQYHELTSTALPPTFGSALHFHDLISRVRLYIVVLWYEGTYRELITDGIRILFPLISISFVDKSLCMAELAPPEAEADDHSNVRHSEPQDLPKGKSA